MPAAAIALLAEVFAWTWNEATPAGGRRRDRVGLWGREGRMASMQDAADALLRAVADAVAAEDAVHASIVDSVPDDAEELFGALVEAAVVGKPHLSDALAAAIRGRHPDASDAEVRVVVAALTAAMRIYLVFVANALHSKLGVDFVKHEAKLLRRLVEPVILFDSHRRIHAGKMVRGQWRRRVTASQRPAVGSRAEGLAPQR